MNEQATMMNQQQQQLMNLNQNMMNSSQINSQLQPQMVSMNRGYNIWAAPQPQFQNPNPGTMKTPVSSFKKSLGPRNNWKGKKVNKLNDKRRNDQQHKFLMSGSSSGGIAGGVNTVAGGSLGNLKFTNYQPPTLNELQHQNRLKTRKFFPKKFNKNINMNMNMNLGASNNNYYYSKNNSRSAPYAPRNTTSFIIRAKKSGGIASLVSPSPMTPSVLPTPIFSPSREVLVDMAKEEWGVDGYGSMKGLIRLRSPGHEMEVHEDEEEDEEGSSESDVEEHVEVERRLDHDLSRFEMIYDPNNIGGAEYQNVLENRVDDQDTHIAHLEEENLILKERLFLVERELADLRRRMHYLERRGNKGEGTNEEVENESENESGSHGEGTHSMESNDLIDDSIVNIDDLSKEQGDGRLNSEGSDAAGTIDKSIVFGFEKKVDDYDSVIAETDQNAKDKLERFTGVDGEEKESFLKDIEETSSDENKNIDVEVKMKVKMKMKVKEAANVAGGDDCMEEIGVAKNTKIADLKGEIENTVTDHREENDNDKNDDVESSEGVGSDANMEEAGVAKANTGLQSISANTTDVNEI